MTAGPQRGAVLLAEYSDPRLAVITDQALLPHELRALSDQLHAGGGRIIVLTPRRTLAFYPMVGEALASAQVALTLAAAARQVDPNRHSLAARVVLGYGLVNLEQARLHSDWTHRLGAQLSQVPPHTVAGLQEFVDQLGPAATPKPLAKGLWLLQAADREAVETQMASPLHLADGGVFDALGLRVRGENLSVAPRDCPVLIGRDRSCGLRLTSPSASRVHGRIEYHGGKFYYVDASRNGSYVLTAAGEELRLVHDRIVLAGSGAISPGAPIGQQQGEVVRFITQSRRLGMADGDAARGGDTQERPLPRRNRE